LFDAQWIGLPADRLLPESTGPEPAWRVVRTAAELTDWERSRQAEDPDADPVSAPPLFQPALLDDPDIRFLAGITGDRIVATAIANRSVSPAGQVVGVSNIGGTGGGLPAQARAAVAAVRDAFPGLPVVGYEHGDDLAAMAALGFLPLGPLRIWVTG
jgi:hypothetical protein